eukprot:Gb_27118 [translate_table: standard]
MKAKIGRSSLSSARRGDTGSALLFLDDLLEGIGGGQTSKPIGREEKMAITNFIVTVVGVGAVILLLRGDVKQSAGIFKRNMRQIRTWLEEESASASQEVHQQSAVHAYSPYALQMSPRPSPAGTIDEASYYDISLLKFVAKKLAGNEKKTLHVRTNLWAASISGRRRWELSMSLTND